MRKPKLCDQVRLRMVCSSTEASKSREIYDIAAMGIIIWEKLFMPYANNKGADQPAHLHSLISAFVVRCLDSTISAPLLFAA